MRRLLTVLCVVGCFACDFDAAYQQRCAAGLCGSAGGSAGGGNATAGGSAAGGNAMAGGSAAAGGDTAGGNATGGGSTAGGMSTAGGSAADAGTMDGGPTGGGDAGCLVTFSTPDASVFSATECFPFEVQLTCNGVPTPAPVTFQSRYVPMSTAGAGTFFSSSDCQGPISSALTGQRSFRVASTGLAATAGSWELTATAMGTSSTRLVTFSGKLESAAVTQLMVGVCLPLPAPRFVGLNDSSLVAYGLPATFELTVPPDISVCGSPTTFTLNGGQSMPGSMPSLRATSYFPGVRTLRAAEQNVTNLGLQVAFDLTVCASDGGVVPAPSGCCQPAGSVAVDGGYQCP